SDAPQRTHEATQAESNAMDMSPQEREAAARRIPENLLTEPMTIQELAGLFKINRNKMALILKGHMPEAVQFGSLWRLPVAKMPPQYFEERSLSIFDAPNCNDPHRQSTADHQTGEN
ncbi:hypothetical protein, partial [Gimesia sp.]|uniref:hypothetical protein n=2 Tax=Gimesia TaxID=1649453 RepID=UPI0025BF7D41